MLFKYVYDKASNEASQDESLKRYCGALDANMDWFSLQEVILDVELKYLRPLIGEAFYNELVSQYQGSPSANHLALIRWFQRSLAYYVYFQLINTRGIHVSDLGAQEAISKDGTMIASRQWKTKDALRNAWKIANERMDRALEYLESNKASFSTWTNSEAYTKARSLFFNTPTELSAYMPLDCERVVYTMLRPHIRESEIKYIKPLMGDSFFDEIKAAIHAAPDTPLTQAQQNLLDKIRWSLVKWTNLAAIPQMRLRTNELGLIEPDFDNSTSSKSSQPATEPVVRSQYIHEQFSANIFQNNLKSWLWENADDYPTYKASDLYKEDTPPTAFLDDFNQKSTGLGSLL